jgi:hypothetical protein
MKFAFCKKNNLLGKIIKWWDRGPYEHVECVIAENADGTYNIASSAPGEGVRILVNQTLPADLWDLVDVPSVSASKVIEWFKEHDGEEYYYAGLFGFVIRPAVGGSKSKWFCSEACLKAAFDMDHAWRFSPNAMYEVVTRIQ